MTFPYDQTRGDFGTVIEQTLVLHQNDYEKAFALHHSGSGEIESTRVRALVAIVAAVIALAAAITGPALYPLVGIVAVMVVALLASPRLRARSIRKQLTSRDPDTDVVDIRMDDVGYHSTSRVGVQLGVPWTQFVDSKENDAVLLLYSSKVQFLILPLDQISAEAAEFARSHLAQASPTNMQ